jgi:outer membrane biosynthesis protein TonB
LVAGGIYLGLKKKHPSTSVSESGTNPQPLVTEEKPLEPELEPEVKTEGAAPAPGKMTGPPKKPLPVPKSKTKPEPEPEAEAEAKTLEEPKPAASQILHPQKLKRIGVWLNHLVSEGIISAKKDFIENRANMLQELKVHTQNNEEFQKHLKTVQPYLAKLSVKNPDDNPTQYAAEIGHDKLIEATAYLRDNVHVNSSLGNVPEHYQYLSQLHDHLVAERDTLLKSVKQEHLT